MDTVGAKVYSFIISPPTKLSRFYKTQKKKKISSSSSSVYYSYIAMNHTFRSKANHLVNVLSHKAVAVGRNYESHVQEMGHKLWSMKSQEKPILFIKPSTSYIRPGRPILLPPGVNVEHEVELGIVIGKEAKNIKTDQIWDYIYGYFCGIDLTIRNWQMTFKNQGKPWELCKALDGFLGISQIVERNRIEGNGFGREKIKKELWLNVNGKERQRECTNHMIWSVNEILSYVSTRFTLRKGDLVITGTPKGVGPLVPGDHVQAGIDDVVSMEFDCELNKEWID